MRYTMIDRLASSALLTVALLAGCGDDAGLRDGSMTMHLTDAPADSITAAVVTVEQIYLQSGDDSTDAGGRVVLLDSAFTVDLRDLQNTSQQLFENITIPGGAYAQLRFVISGGYIEVSENGEASIYATSPDYEGLPAGATVDGELQMPSFAQSGLKVTIGSGALRFDGDHRIILVDFDVSQSFGHGAGPDTWVMHPVIIGSEIEATGSVEGTVSLAPGVALPNALTLADLQVRLGGETQALLFINGEFRYDFDLVVPGRYAFGVVAPAGVTITVTPALPDTVTVSSGATLTQDIVITAAE
jgi:hypothetical protein